MALDGDRLGAAIVAAIKVINPVNGNGAEEAAMLAQWKAIAGEIVTEIQGNGVVNTAGTVTSGPGAGGSTVATGTVT